MKKSYRIAENIIEIVSEEENDVWAKVEMDYEPFRVGETDSIQSPAVRILLVNGLAAIQLQWPMIYSDIPEDPSMLKLYVYQDPQGSLYFKFIQPQDTKERVVLKMSPDYGEATAYIEEKNESSRPWQATASLTASLQVAYYLSTHKSGILFSHASSVLKDGKAYLFLGKSGTGKSTHSRMWKEAFPDTVLLNDDHPMIKIDETGQVRAYGSPWSGKTRCYKNLSAPIGAIVRIRRGKNNTIRKQSPLEAYASVLPSMFSAPFDREVTDARHQWIEKLVANVPCYELQCLPDADAARVCWKGIENTLKIFEK